MANSFPSVVTSVSAVQVGNFFVGQYYKVLQQQPDFVHQFYTDASKMTRIDGPVVETANTMLQIHSLIMSLNFTSIEIKTAHSMDSWNGGVLVMVSGFVQVEEFSGRKKFAQSFFLAPQEKGYFVLNDIFQFLDEEQSLEHPATMLDHENHDSKLNTSEPEPVTDYVLERDIQDDEYASVVHTQESESVDKYSIPEPQQTIPEIDTRIEEDVKVEEPSISYPTNSVSTARDPPPALAEEPFEEPIKHTYASILRSKAHPAPSVPQPSLPKPAPVVSEWDQPQQPAPTQYHPQQSVPEKLSAETADENLAYEDEGEVTSVYVRNLPSSATEAELEQEFKKFGRIKPYGVLIKARKELGVYYAFVEFEDITGVQNALKASPVLLNGCQIYVEERRAGAGARGRRGRGRGGYQFESSRGGRYGASRTYGRGSGLQDSARDYNNRPRGNGYQRGGGSRQERGILGPQSSRNGQSQFDAAY